VSARAALLLALSACATSSATTLVDLSPVPDDPRPEEFRASGEIRTSQGSAAFDDWRVVGPRVNLVRQEDGTWSGTILGVDVSARPSQGKLVGAGVNLSFVRWRGEVITRGRIGALSVNVRLVPGAGTPADEGIYCRLDANLVDCRPERQIAYGGIRLLGVAAITDAPLMPQLGLALLAAAR
jgi:hypothetical protein